MQPAADRRAHRAARLQPRRGRGPVRRPRRRGGPHHLLCPQPPRGRADLPDRAQAAGGDSDQPAASLPTAPDTRRSSGARSSGTWPAATCSAWSRPTRSSWGSTSATSTRRSPSPSPAPSRACASSGAAPGRTERGGLAMYVAGDDALDQFFCRHPTSSSSGRSRRRSWTTASETIFMRHLCVAALRGPAGAGRRRDARPRHDRGRRPAGGGRAAAQARRALPPARLAVPGRARSRCARPRPTASRSSRPRRAR